MSFSNGWRRNDDESIFFAITRGIQLEKIDSGDLSQTQSFSEWLRGKGRFVIIAYMEGVALERAGYGLDLIIL